MSTILSEQSLAALTDIRRWFDSALGVQILDTEQAVLDELLNGFFGYHLLQVSVQQKCLNEASPVLHKFSLGLTVTDDVPVIANASELPLASDSIDVILVHHLLDFLSSPQETLREIARVSLPMGHLVIVGFNPLSSWGLWKIPASFTGRVPWNGRFILPSRLMDWLNELNFRIDRAQYYFYKLPLIRRSPDGGVEDETASGVVYRPDFSKGLSRGVNLPLGAIYVIVARKHLGTLTPFRPVWRDQRAMGQLSQARPVRREPSAARNGIRCLRANKSRS